MSVWVCTQIIDPASNDELSVPADEIPIKVVEYPDIFREAGSTWRLRQAFWAVVRGARLEYSIGEHGFGSDSDKVIDEGLRQPSTMSQEGVPCIDTVRR